MRNLLIIFMLLPGFVFSQDVSNLKLKDVNGKTFVMEKHLANDATIILFWATYCIPCKKEFPAIQQLQKKYANKKIQVIAISTDSPRSLAKVKSFVKTHDYNFTFLLDSKGEISSKLLVNAVPHSMLVDTKSKIIYSHTGYRKGDELQLEQELLKLWKQPKKRSTTKQK